MTNPNTPDLMDTLMNGSDLAAIENLLKGMGSDHDGALGLVTNPMFGMATEALLKRVRENQPATDNSTELAKLQNEILRMTREAQDLFMDLTQLGHGEITLARLNSLCTSYRPKGEDYKKGVSLKLKAFSVTTGKSPAHRKPSGTPFQKLPDRIKGVVKEYTKLLDMAETIEKAQELIKADSKKGMKKALEFIAKHGTPERKAKLGGEAFDWNEWRRPRKDDDVDNLHDDDSSDEGEPLEPTEAEDNKSDDDTTDEVAALQAKIDELKAKMSEPAPTPEPTPTAPAPNGNGSQPEPTPDPDAKAKAFLADLKSGTAQEQAAATAAANGELPV